MHVLVHSRNSNVVCHVRFSVSSTVTHHSMSEQCCGGCMVLTMYRKLTYTVALYGSSIVMLQSAAMQVTDPGTEKGFSQLY